MQRSSLPATILQAAHAYGAISVRHVSALLDLPQSTASYHVKALMAGRWLLDAGFACCDPKDPHYAHYYLPALKQSQAEFTDVIKRHHLFRNRDATAVRTNLGAHLPQHTLWCLHVAEWLSQLTAGLNVTARIEPEFLLRAERGWYGAGRPPKHPNSFLTSVPDLLICGESGPDIHVEIELVEKSATRYAKILSRFSPPNKPVLYVTHRAPLTQAVRRLLPNQGSLQCLTIYDSTAAIPYLQRALHASLSTVN